LNAASTGYKEFSNHGEAAPKRKYLLIQKVVFDREQLEGKIGGIYLISDK